MKSMTEIPINTSVTATNTSSSNSVEYGAGIEVDYNSDDAESNELNDDDENHLIVDDERDGEDDDIGNIRAPNNRTDNTNSNNNNNNDDESAIPSDTVVVSYTKASETKFFSICKGLETVCRNNRKRVGNEKRMSDVDKLKTVLKPEYLKWLAEPSTPNGPYESIFPIMRLLLPDKDSSRSFQMKEKTLAKMYIDAFGFGPNTSKYQKLIHYNDPKAVFSTTSTSIVPTKSVDEGIVGDFSLVAHNVLKEYKGNDKAIDNPSERKKLISIGDMNRFLDELASLPRKAREIKSNHDWRRPNNNTTTSTSGNSNKKPPNLNQLRADWLQRINTDVPGRRGLSALENKWLIRILLNKLHIGVGWKTLLKWYNPYAAMLWSAHNSLKGICDKLCDPEFVKQQELIHKKQAGINDGNDDDEDDENNNTGYMPQSMVSPQFGTLFSPMLSERTGFDRVLHDISKRHRDYMLRTKGISKSLLSLQNPAFAVEPKLDGERFLVHISKDGVVKMHTRRGNWYSDLYSPVLGPPVRAALARWSFDVILDGEVIAWDSGRQETVPFGNNRTIAKIRKDWMEHHGGLDKRDLNIHVDDTNDRSMNASNTWNDKNNQPYELAGKECWLQFTIFDVIYVNGFGSEAFLDAIVSPNISPRPSPGSIINLSCFERKKILYKLVTPQKDKVEIINTWIVRPNGRLAIGEDYFNPNEPSMECGYPEHTLDSPSCILSGIVQNIEQIDTMRRRGLSDAQISQSRAHAVQKIYDITVENQRMEGLIFKDLSSPYYLGEESKAQRYWHKFKPDYFNGSVASDIDVVVIGAYFATGLRFSGKPSTFLCACIDSEDDERYFTLCKVSMGSIDTETAMEFLESTGFSTENQQTSSEAANNSRRNAWFREQDHGKALPEFLSNRSYQRKSTDGSWRFEKKDYPDFWIHPEDSGIVTLNAGEIVISESFSAGITLRFPRINRIRFGADDKPRSEIENDVNLWRIYQDVIESRSSMGSGGETTKTLGSPVRQNVDVPCRFLTEEQFAESKRNKPKRLRSAKEVAGVSIPLVQRKISNALHGLVFHVCDGNYCLESTSCGMKEAKDEGWLEEGLQVYSKKDVQSFILNHGGIHVVSPNSNSTIVLGGMRNDPRVLAFVATVERARSNTKTSKLKSNKAIIEAAIAEREGCLRWTFVYSLVHNWLKRSGTTMEMSIKEHDPQLLKPSLLDFLLRPTRNSERLNGVEVDLLNTHIGDVRSLCRAIEIVCETESNSKRAKNCVSSWRRQAIDNLAADERWVAKCNHQVLWPFNKGDPDLGSTSLVVMYPHIFHDLGELHSTAIIDGMNEARWSCCIVGDAISSTIESVLPLARIMGAMVVSHLNYSVTHVLCDLREHDEIAYTNNVTELVFRDKNRGNMLINRLKILAGENSITSIPIKLISCNWLRKRKWHSFPHE